LSLLSNEPISSLRKNQTEIKSRKWELVSRRSESLIARKLCSPSQAVKEHDDIAKNRILFHLSLASYFPDNFRGVNHTTKLQQDEYLCKICIILMQNKNNPIYPTVLLRKATIYKVALSASQLLHLKPGAAFHGALRKVTASQLFT